MKSMNEISFGGPGLQETITFATGVQNREETHSTVPPFNQEDTPWTNKGGVTKTCCCDMLCRCFQPGHLDFSGHQLFYTRNVWVAQHSVHELELGQLRLDFLGRASIVFQRVINNLSSYIKLYNKRLERTVLFNSQHQNI